MHLALKSIVLDVLIAIMRAMNIMVCFLALYDKRPFPLVMPGKVCWSAPLGRWFAWAES